MRRSAGNDGTNFSPTLTKLESGRRGLKQRRPGQIRDGWREIHKILRKELLVVAAEIPAFGSFHPTSAETDLSNLEELGTQLEAKAPRRRNLLFDLCCPPWASRPQNFSSGFVLISSILYFTMQQQKCDNLPTLLGMFLVGAGLKERGANILNTLGVLKS
jgi:hypothetical protein